MTNNFEAYLRHAFQFANVQTGVVPIVIELLKISSRNKDNSFQVYLNATLKREIANKCKVSLARIDNVLSVLVKKGIFDRVGKGTYTFSQEYFGTYRNIEEDNCITATFDYANSTITKNF